MLRELASTQPDSDRAASVLYLFHVCGQTDSHIAQQLGSSEDAITKYRQRLEKAGKAHFVSEEAKAA
jgi:predicted transcriptional regulator